jgi:hypothetical protein
MDDLGGANPGVFVVPPDRRPVARGNVLHVDQDLVSALTAPDRDARVPRVHQDRPDGGLAPARTVSVRVASAVVVCSMMTPDCFVNAEIHSPDSCKLSFNLPAIMRAAR